MITNPIGAVYRVGEVWSRDKAVAHSKAAQHFTTTSLDDFSLAQSLKNDAGVSYSIYRNTTWEPGDLKGKNAADIKQAAKTAYQAIENVDRRIHVLINNEQEWTAERFVFYKELLKLTMADPKGPVGMVFGNFSSGSVKSGQNADENWWTWPTVQEFLYLLDDLADIKLPDGTHAFILGIHEYTALYPWSASNGGENLVNNWPERATSPIDWKKAQFHLGRTIQGIRSAGLPVPYMIVTETLFDDMRDIIDAWNVRLKPSVSGLRGYKTHEDFWKKFGYLGAIGSQYHAFIEWAWEHVWASSDKILGVQVYIYDGSGRLDGSFDVAQNREFLAANRDYRITNDSTPEPEPLPPPITDDVDEAFIAILDLQNRVMKLEKALVEQRDLNELLVTKNSLQGYFQNLMNWTALNFTSKAAILGWLSKSKDAATEAFNLQNVEEPGE